MIKCVRHISLFSSQFSLINVANQTKNSPQLLRPLIDFFRDVYSYSQTIFVTIDSIFVWRLKWWIYNISVVPQPSATCRCLWNFLSLQHVFCRLNRAVGVCENVFCVHVTTAGLCALPEFWPSQQLAVNAGVRAGLMDTKRNWEFLNGKHQKTLLGDGSGVQMSRGAWGQLKDCTTAPQSQLTPILALAGKHGDGCRHRR